jgi:hypothetical protein
MKAFTISILILTTAAFCLAFSKKPAAGPVEFETVFMGQHSTVDTAAVYLINNNEQWDKIWKLSQGMITPMPETKQIDFDKYDVIAVFMGQKNSGGYSVEITDVIRDGDNLNVKVTNHISSGGMMLPVVVNPCHLVQIPKGEYKLNVEYSDKKE